MVPLQDCQICSWGHQIRTSTTPRQRTLLSTTMPLLISDCATVGSGSPSVSTGAPHGPSVSERLAARQIQSPRPSRNDAFVMNDCLPFFVAPRKAVERKVIAPAGASRGADHV